MERLVVKAFLGYILFILILCISNASGFGTSSEELSSRIDADLFLDDEGVSSGDGGVDEYGCRRDDEDFLSCHDKKKLRTKSKFEDSLQHSNSKDKSKDSFGGDNDDDEDRKRGGGGVISSSDDKSNSHNNNNNNDNRDSNHHLFNSKTEAPTSFFSQPGILAAIICGAIVGLLCAILLVMFIVYRMRKKDEGSYVLEDSKRTSSTYGKAKEFYA